MFTLVSESKTVGYREKNDPLGHQNAIAPMMYRLLERLVDAGYLEARKSGRKAEYSLFLP